MDILQDSIAIVGIACRFPGANSKEEFWENLIANKETVKRFTDEELGEYELEFDKIKDNPNFVKARGILDDIDKWDAQFFNVLPGEAKVIDPQHRLWLENTWHAFEDAGLNPYTYNGNIGVFTGSFVNTYLLNNVLRDPLKYEQYIRLRTPEQFQAYINSDPMFLATKTAYHFNLKGPAINIQTACSTSLVAVSQACSSLLSFESDVCVSGGVTVITPQQTGYMYQEGAISSPDGHCKPFDKESRGTVFGNGVGTVILKRLSDAISNNDRVYGIIRGWATNNDGYQKIGFTAPGIDGQYKVITAAQSFADINAGDIQYIEAHGTATPLGDPIEVTALTKAFRDTTEKKQFCGIGSVKSNIGHLDVAAGIAGLIKVALSAYYHKIPATLHYNEPNPRIDFANSPFYVLNKNMDWEESKPLIMGVSSFGVGGTNAHVIVSDFIQDYKSVTNSQPKLLLHSARSKNSLDKMNENLSNFLSRNSEVHLDDLSYTLQQRRTLMPFRSFAVVNNGDVSKVSFTASSTEVGSNELVFMFPGQGAQFASMGNQLYNTEPIFKQNADKCFSYYKEITGTDFKEILFAPESEQATKTLAQTKYTQPALFIVEYCTACLYKHFGIRPDYLIGHSIGEYVAACLSGVFDLKSALSIVIKRGELMQSMPEGSMMAINTNAENLKVLKGDLFEVAADNSQAMCSISYPSAKEAEIKEMLESKGYYCIPLRTSHAFHSKAFEPILDEFQNFVNSLPMYEPEVPFISCLTGKFIEPEQAISGNYWAQQLRNSVLFKDGIGTLAEKENVVFLEVGPNTHLSGMVLQNEAVKEKGNIVKSIGKPDKNSEQIKFYKSLGELWNRGIVADFSLFYTEGTPKLIDLPSYPFEKKTHWIDFKLNAANIDFTASEKKSFSENFETDEQADVTPSNVIVKIWEEVFGIENIKPEDNFFNLGGHSLLALQILTRLKERFNISISLKTFLDNPSISMLENLISNKDEVKNENVQTISHLTDYSHLPLSDSQRRLWIITQLDNLSPAYNIPVTFRLMGELKFDILQKTVEKIFERQNIVYSTYKIDPKGEPYCQISDSRKIDIKQYDLSGYSGDEKKIKTNQIIGSDSREIFDLEVGPLFRVLLLKTDNNDHIFHMTIHHLVFDGLSWAIFIREFNQIYDSYSKGTEINLYEIKYHQYDYANWIKKSEEHKDESESVKFWENRLAGISQLTNFPFDRPRKKPASGLGLKEYLCIPSDISKKIRDFSIKENVTVFNTVLAAFSFLIHKYSGDSDFCIGSPVSSRPQQYLENIFGMFVNTITLRFQYEDIHNFKELVQYSKNTALEAISHQELPFEKVVEIVKPERSFLSSPIFQIAFAWQNILNVSIKADTIIGERITIEEGISPFDLTFYMWENGEIIEGEIEYNIDLLDKESVVRLKNNFINLLSVIVDKCQENLDIIPIISEVETDFINKLNQTGTDYPKDKDIIKLFQEQVFQYPDFKAISHKGKSLTYKELNQKSNQLARKLQTLSLSPNEPVGLLVSKSIDMVVAILAILKSKCAYLPIDPEYPRERINFIISDANCQFILYNETFNKLVEAPINKLNLESADSYEKDSSDLNIFSSPEDLAYIMYTSGTTGQPKGSMIMHKSVVRLVRNTNYIDLTHNDRILLTGAIVFDATTFEIWGALLNGATLYIVDKEVILDSEALGNELLNNKITTLWLTSPLFTHLAEINSGIFKDLKYLLVGGDVLSPNHINKVRSENSNIQIINGYGPTENTTFSTCFTIDKDYSENIPIGKPISNSTTYILDKKLNYVPIGVLGELYVGGDGISKGYLKRPDLNKEKFIQHPIFKDQVLFKTGDYARWLADGNIEFHGRIDNQLKIRGFRVELEEIELALMEHEEISEAVVKPIFLSSTDIRLVSFVHVAHGMEFDISKINIKLKDRLPQYMIPSYYKVMDELPKTINGKIDKKLLVFDIKNDELEKETVEKLLTESQQKILNVWSEVLKDNRIGIKDNFFDVGGNSLLAISIVSRIEKIFGLKINIRNFFDSPNIYDFAEYLDCQNILPKPKKDINLSHETVTIIKGEL